MRISLFKTYKGHCSQKKRLTQWYFIGRRFLENTVLRERYNSITGQKRGQMIAVQYDEHEKERANGI